MNSQLHLVRGDSSDYWRERRLLGVREVAEILGVSPAFVRAHANGRCQPCIVSVKIGKLLKFKYADVVSFIEQQRRAARP